MRNKTVRLHVKYIGVRVNEGQAETQPSETSQDNAQIEKREREANKNSKLKMRAVICSSYLN